jgi:hypothetical protein
VSILPDTPADGTSEPHRPEDDEVAEEARMGEAVEEQWGPQDKAPVTQPTLREAAPRHEAERKAQKRVLDFVLAEDAPPARW